MFRKEEREETEWTNTWWSKANTNSKRGLLIGDSTTRQWRRSVETLLLNTYAIDLFASSFSIHDIKFWDYIGMLFKDNEYKYDFIVLNYGGHHGFSRLCSKSVIEYNAYEEKYLQLLNFLKDRCENVICMTGTSEVLDTDINVIDEEIEREVIARNHIVANVACSNGAKVFDLYDLMKKNSKEYIYCDRCHFGRESDYFISYHLLQFMYSQNLIRRNLISEKRAQARKKLTEFLGRGRKCMVYGAGVGGNELYWILKWNELESMINCFIVSHKIDKDEILQKSIVLVDELTLEEREGSTFIIASDKYKDDMYRKMGQLRIKHVVYYRDVVNILTEI